MLVTGANFDGLLDDELQKAVQGKKFDNVDAVLVTGESAAIDTIGCDELHATNLTVGEREDPQQQITVSTMEVRGDVVDIGVNNPCTVNIEGSLNYNGHSIEELLADAGAGAQLQIENIDNDSVKTENLTVTNYTRLNDLLVGRNETKGDYKMEAFSVFLPEDPDDRVKINMGSEDAYDGGETPKLIVKGREVNLAVRGDSRFWGNLFVIGDIYQNGKTLTNIVQAEVGDAFKAKQKLGKVEVTSFKKTGVGEGDFMDLGDPALVLLKVGQGFTTLPTFINTHLTNVSGFAPQGKLVTICDNLKVIDNITCGGLTVNNTVGDNVGLVKLGQSDKLKVSVKNANNNKYEEKTFDDYIKNTAGTLTSLGTANKNFTFNGNVKCAKLTASGDTTLQKLTCNGEIKAGTNAIACGTLTAKTKIYFGNDNLSLNSDGKIVFNSLEKYNRKTNTGNVYLGNHEYIKIWDGTKDIDLPNYIYDHSKSSSVLSSEASSNFGTYKSVTSAVIGNKFMQTLSVISKETTLPAYNTIKFVGSTKSLKDLIDEAAAKGGGGGTTGDVSKACTFAYDVSVKDGTAWIGYSGKEEYDQSMYINGKRIGIGENRCNSIYIGHNMEKQAGIVSPTIHIGGQAITNTYIESGELYLGGAKKVYIGPWHDHQDEYTEVTIGAEKTDLHLKGRRIYIGNDTVREASNKTQIFFYYTKKTETKNEAVEGTTEEGTAETEEEEVKCLTLSMEELANVLQGKYVSTEEGANAGETTITPGFVVTENATVNSELSALNVTVTGDLITNTITSDYEDGVINVKRPLQIQNEGKGDSYSTTINGGNINAYEMRLTHEMNGTDATFTGGVTANSITCNELNVEGDELPVKKKMRFEDPLQNAVMNRTTQYTTHKIKIDTIYNGEKSLGDKVFNIVFTRINELYVAVSAPSKTSLAGSSWLTTFNDGTRTISSFSAETMGNIFPDGFNTSDMASFSIPFIIRATYTDGVYFYNGGLWLNPQSNNMEINFTGNVLEKLTKDNQLLDLDCIPGTAMVLCPIVEAQYYFI